MGFSSCDFGGRALIGRFCEHCGRSGGAVACRAVRWYALLVESLFMFYEVHFSFIRLSFVICVSNTAYRQAKNVEKERGRISFGFVAQYTRRRGGACAHPVRPSAPFGGSRRQHGTRHGSSPLCSVNGLLTLILIVLYCASSRSTRAASESGWGCCRARPTMRIALGYFDANGDECVYRNKRPA